MPIMDRLISSNSDLKVQPVVGIKDTHQQVAPTPGQARLELRHFLHQSGWHSSHQSKTWNGHDCSCLPAPRHNSGAYCTGATSQYIGSSTPPAVLLSGSTKVRFCSYGPLQLRMASSIGTTAPWYITAHPFPACYSTASAHSDADNGSHCVHRVPGRLGRRQPAAPATWRAYCAAPLPASPAARGCCPAPAARWRTSDSCRWHSRSRDPERSRWASLIRVTVRFGS